ncbi:CAP domain-containing protein [Streptomyces carpinensis]|uniref:CAP domain-containing protein n=1 Tax=Streptomyces carpinensis TaxID=66369 RepID=A0ABV1VUR9_9ACTN|nr:CAP domain-containing protein [Streptomyces carpinensis]
MSPMTFHAPRVKAALTFASAGLLSTTLIQVTAAPPASADGPPTAEGCTLWLRYADMPVIPHSAFSDLATLCLIQAERAKAGKAPIPRPQELLHPNPLGVAAERQVEAAVNQKWWTPSNPDWHTNPVSKSTPESRAKDAGYCPGGSPQIAEIVYNGWNGGGTPRAAVKWWMGSPTHHDIILGIGHSWNNFAAATNPDVADPAGKDGSGKGAFVVVFGQC